MTEDLSKTNNAPDGSTSELTAAIAPGYWIRSVLIGLMCLVLGLWGIYDYVVVIPNAEQMSQRREVTQEVKTALESNSDPQTDAAARSAALRMIDDAMDEITPDQAGQKSGSDQTEDDVLWPDMLATWKNCLQGMTGFSDTPTPEMQNAGLLVVEAMGLYGEAQPPSAYDRPVQWMFIASLIFVPFYLWGVMKYGPRTYRLDEEGAVHTPEGVFQRDQIEDIDMSRWMAKSTAQLVLVDGRRIKLDAYIFKNLHLIIGSLAHQMHPTAWTEEAKQVKDEKSPESTTDEES